jgi:pyruvate, water dikinase
VAVRSSATAEDTADTSFAGMNETFTNVRGHDQLIERIKRCWASLFGTRVVAYRAEQGLTAEPAIAVIVQSMIASDRSGVMFTVDPAARDQLVIEGAFGLGEVVVSGRVEPDTYHADRSSLVVREIRVGRKDVRIISGPEGDEHQTIEGDAARQASSASRASGLGGSWNPIRPRSSNPVSASSAVVGGGPEWSRRATASTRRPRDDILRKASSAPVASPTHRFMTASGAPCTRTPSLVMTDVRRRRGSNGKRPICP